MKKIFIICLAVLCITGVSFAATTVFTDDFNRTVSNGWGNSWTLEGSSSLFSVDGQGHENVATPGTNIAAMTPNLVQDVDVVEKASTNKVPTGASVWLYNEIRRAGGNSYRLKVRFDPNGNTYAGISRVVSNAETNLISETLVGGLNYITGINVRVQAVGINPTALRVRVWSGVEPSTWNVSANDSTATLQQAGAVGLRSYGSRSLTNTPIDVKVDDYVVTDLASNPPPPPSDAVLVGAGDIASSNSGDTATANLLDGIAGTVYTLGDNVYQSGTLSEFNAYYEPTWGRHKSRTFPSAGNHDYSTGNANGYFAYFGAAAGDPTKGYYSYNLGNWHIIVLNANCSFVSCATGSTQEQWLRSDLAANPTQCTLAMWHQARFSSGGEHGNDGASGPFWVALYQAGADVILSGHDHNYERFAPQTPSQVSDPINGIREFVVGTGGASHQLFGVLQPNSEVRDATSFGVLKLTLHLTSYDWQFIPVAGASFTDSGSGNCH